METKMFRIRFDEEVRVEGVQVISSRIGCDDRRMVAPEDSPSAKKFIEQIREDAELNGVFYLDDGNGECLHISWHEIFTRSVTVELAC